ncbi:ATP-grasp peptide maturase system methyltransferase [Prauserella muralis]|uniref:Protein-L-isoaspartate O-methyltransferase n=1 Tax=Prauserella muralis TaxID=588067 RepID=A0A2V4BMV2_9PSEU|nr:ATP-grasp peptide maturase system methyltransferase [Prauserella muralis]PXY31973.1 protein-L-isoaspartate O-methyltransferase [Prauserella muralis]TWE13598.1 methyltransferase of ATP-grasp peptide maturase system [Prauserella muralis]
MSFASRERRRLADRLRRDGATTDPRWLRAFRQVPRHAFLPRFYVPEGSRWLAVADGDAGWLETCYSDCALVTQLDDDPGRWEQARRDGPVSGVPTSSSSMPGIMAVMLEALCVRDGDRVLEVGTGTGYNAALLCCRLGDENVVTVDIDPAVLLPARASLAALGYAPGCEIADGELGLPERAPYDRVLCTCSVSRIPPAWLEQCRPGGLVVTTLNRPIGAGLVRLVAGEGATGQGRVLPHDGRFMPMRAHRLPAAGGVLAGRVATAKGTTALPVSTVLDPAGPFEFFAGLALPGVTVAADPDDEGASYLVHPDGSWAGHRTVDGEFRVEQGGPRRLWDLVEEAYELWLALGEPTRGDFAVTVDGEHQEFRLGDHAWPLR